MILCRMSLQFRNRIYPLEPRSKHCYFLLFLFSAINIALCNAEKIAFAAIDTLFYLPFIYRPQKERKREQKLRTKLLSKEKQNKVKIKSE